MPLMSHVIELTDEQYETLRQVAVARGQTPDAVIAAWLEEARERAHEPRYYETDDWLRHLGVSEERIQRANARIAEEEGQEAMTDADAS
jgi:transcription initiation factor TFIIIB Brf1 subunit/transcription initiation factor TFIIB